ncbi:16S rRNA (cytidine(1402)-2'-O)-methyltransferase [Desulfobacterota bacterium AH_259_B03_O07]|nr:16S rRNA (cytidine(1402)-2'-O)-methyltransferase [Desulfobacterota bacterium AH_259_B03_O07]
MKGKLFIVSTPIGNLDDISLRALRILKEVDLIACEDTRTTKKLLSHYQVKKPLTSYHEHNEVKKAQKLLKQLESGKNIALVSDAGTPGISDPGYRIVKLASENGIDVISVPGSTASIAALSISGLPTSSFAFFGFPPKTKSKKGDFFKEFQEVTHTLVFYESPRRVLDTLKHLLEILGDREISVSRELTKIFEETTRGKTSKVIDRLQERTELKGEFTIVVEGNKNKGKYSIENLEKRLRFYREKGLSLKDTVERLTNNSKIPKNRIYREALRIWKKSKE